MSGGKSETPEGSGTEDNAGGKGSSKKLLMIGLAAGLLLGGGVAAGYFLFLAPQTADTAAVAEQEEPKLSSAIFVKLERLSAPLVVDQQVAGYILLDVSLELVDAADEAMLTQRLPILKDAFLREVTRAPIGKADQPMVIDYENLAERLKTVANQELKRSVIDRVLITQTTRI